MLPSLCKIAWEWFLALGSSCFSSVGKVQGFFCLFYVRWGWENKTGKKCFAQLGKKQVLRALGENHLSGGKALDWVGENTSAKRSYFKKGFRLSKRISFSSNVFIGFIFYVVSCFDFICIYPFIYLFFFKK